MLTSAVDTRIGPIPAVDSGLSRSDRWGSVKARWGLGRMDYRVEFEGSKIISNSSPSTALPDHAPLR